MDILWLIDSLSLVLNLKILAEFLEKIFRRQTVEILDYTVVVEYRQLTCREADSHEIVVFLFSRMMGILLCLLGTHQCSSRRAMMPVSDIQMGHLGEFRCNRGDIVLIVDDPELMTEAIIRCHKVINGFCSRIALKESCKDVIVGVSEENWLHIGVAYSDMLHAVLFLVTTCKLMLLNDTGEVIIDRSNDDQTILCLAVHGLCIDVIVLILILYQPMLVLELLEMFGSTGVDARIIFRRTRLEIDLWFDDVIKRHLVVTGLFSCFLRGENVIRA